jgi:hypothetical protein
MEALHREPEARRPILPDESDLGSLEGVDESDEYQRCVQTSKPMIGYNWQSGFISPWRAADESRQAACCGFALLLIGLVRMQRCQCSTAVATKCARLFGRLGLRGWSESHDRFAFSNPSLNAVRLRCRVPRFVGPSIGGLRWLGARTEGSSSLQRKRTCASLRFPRVSCYCRQPCHRTSFGHLNRYSIRCTGVDLDPDLLDQAAARCESAGVSALITLIREDLRATDLARFTIVAMYLLPEVRRSRAVPYRAFDCKLCSLTDRGPTQLLAQCRPRSRRAHTRTTLPTATLCCSAG